MFVLADAASDRATAQAVAAMTAAMGTFLIVFIAMTVFFVWMFWRVFAKAGYSGAMGLLCLIPSVGPLICLIILAFAQWPNERPVVPPAATGTMPMAT
jgi:hypothetical protein